MNQTGTFTKREIREIVEEFFNEITTLKVVIRDGETTVEVDGEVEDVETYIQFAFDDVETTLDDIRALIQTELDFSGDEFASLSEEFCKAL
jgi:hypothetical protein